MPDQSTAASEHALTQDLSALPPTQMQKSIAAIPETDFPTVLRGYDRGAVDAYVERTSVMIAELHATRTPDGAVRRALERVGEQVADILRRAHETAERVTVQSRHEAEDRLQEAAEEARRITIGAKTQLHQLDADTDKVWAERERIIQDARTLAAELMQLADAAMERFPPGDEVAELDGEVLNGGLSNGNGHEGALEQAQGQKRDVDAPAA
jgi:DivIVA domain-containing protein